MWEDIMLAQLQAHTHQIGLFATAAGGILPIPAFINWRMGQDVWALRLVLIGSIVAAMASMLLLRTSGISIFIFCVSLAVLVGTVACMMVANRPIGSG